MILAQVRIRDRSEGSCVQDNGFCPGWIADHWQDYLDPLWRHVQLTVAPVACGLLIAFLLALAARRHRALGGPILLVTSVLYTIPAIALIGILLVPLGFGFVTALIPLTTYTLAILFRNIAAGLDNVPAEVRDAALGMGLTDRQLLWRVELPLALPEILAGVRIATVTTVGLATLAFFAGAGGLGEQIRNDLVFKSNIALAGGLCVLLAVTLELALQAAERRALPWRRA